MELVIIGCWAPYPPAGQACSGYLLKDQQTNILLDCGHGVVSGLGNHIDLGAIDAVVISHFHPDHYVDLYAMRHFIRAAMVQGHRSKPLKVYLPGNPEDKYSYFASLSELEVIELKSGLCQVIGSLQIKFHEMLHTVTSFGIEVSNGSTSFFYSGDTAFGAEVQQAAQNADILLLETSMLIKDSAYAQQALHLTTREAAEIAQNSRAELLIATHFWPGYDINQLEQEITAIYKKELKMANTGLHLTFKGR